VRTAEQPAKYRELVVYKPLQHLETPLKTVIRGRWSEGPRAYAIEVSEIQHIIGIWSSPMSSWVYVLRKHPGLDMLQPSQCGLSDEMDKEMDEDDE